MFCWLSPHVATTTRDGLGQGQEARNSVAGALCSPRWMTKELHGKWSSQDVRQRLDWDARDAGSSCCPFPLFKLKTLGELCTIICRPINYNDSEIFTSSLGSLAPQSFSSRLASPHRFLTQQPHPLVKPLLPRPSFKSHS